MSKRKKAPSNPLRYWIDELIFFRRDFLYLTRAEPDYVGQVIYDLAHEEVSKWRKRRIVTTLSKRDSSYEFNVTAEQPDKNNYNASARATGTIFRDDDDMTVVSGKIVMGTTTTWLLIVVFIVMAMMFLSIEFNLFLIGAYGFVVIFMWLQMYRDRNHLQHEISNAIDFASTTYPQQNGSDDHEQSKTTHTTPVDSGLDSATIRQQQQR